MVRVAHPLIRGYVAAWMLASIVTTVLCILDVLP